MKLKDAIRYFINDPSSAKEFFTGEFWYFIHQKLGSKYVPERIRLQSEWRWLLKADKRCIEGRECRACGCRTPSLFFAPKGCEADIWLGEEPCYPKMISRKEWNKLNKQEKDELFQVHKSKE